tara:strand:- start:758 stop:1405 length:648 start_codon:yes stop_codon:yes gene_type:complete
MHKKEHIYFKLKILIDLVYSENMIDSLSKRKHKLLDKDLSKERYNQYKILIPNKFNKYYIKMSRIMNEEINKKIKSIILYTVARKSKYPQANIGTNLYRSNDRIGIALGIEEPHYALTYLFHEMFHSYFLHSNNRNKYQIELNHLLIEYFTDYKLYRSFTNKKNIFNDKNKIELFQLLDKEYELNNLSATPFKDKVIKDYTKYIPYIKKSKRWRE